MASIGGASVEGTLVDSVPPEGAAVVGGAMGGACCGLQRFSRHRFMSEGQALHELPAT